MQDHLHFLFLVGAVIASAALFVATVVATGLFWFPLL